MGNNKSFAMCPNCGTVLLRARTAGGVEVRCKKCTRKYEIELNSEALKVHEMKEPYKGTA